MTKSLLVLLLMALSGLGAIACGSATKSSGSDSQGSSVAAVVGDVHARTVPLAAPRRPGINDTYDEDDTASRGLEENDDREIVLYGRVANAADTRSATAFVDSYYAAALAEDGAGACSLLIPSLAQGIGGSYETPPDPSYLHGKTCAEVMTKLFKHRHKLVKAEAAGLDVTAVRTGPGRAVVLLAFKGLRDRRYMGLERSGDTWKLGALTDSSYP